MACVFSAIAPFPVPFKPFVIAQGVFGVPLATFVIATFVGCGCLFLIEGFFGARYGTAAKQFLADQKWAAVMIVAILAIAFVFIRRMPMFKRASLPQAD